MDRQTWPPEMFNRLRELMQEGKTNKQIADIFGRTLDSVAHARRRAGLVQKRIYERAPVPDDFKTRAQGLTISATAQIYKRTDSVVKRWFAEAGMTPRAWRAPSGTPWSTSSVIPLDDSMAGRAQRYLQAAVGPVFKVATRNPSDRSGDYFVAGRRMTVQAMIEMADRKQAA